MHYSVTSQINRLSLHDSSFESVIRKGQTIEMIFDWAKLENFLEERIEEGIIMGKTKLLLTGIKSETFIVTPPEPALEYTILPEEFIDEPTMISTTTVDEDIKLVNFYGFSNTDVLQWFDWRFQYDECKISWNVFVTHSDWEKGKLPSSLGEE